MIASILTSLGITAAEKVGKSLLRGINPTEWNRQLNSGMIYHIPSSEVPFIKLLIVKEYERGVFLRDGKLYAVLPPGRWFLGRMPIIGRMELIWVDIGITKMNFGLRTLTEDGVEIGANGVVYLRVEDPEKFVVNLVTGRNVYTSDDLQNFLRDQVNSIMRSEMAKYMVKEVYLEREMFISVSRVKMQEMMSDLGLDFRTLEVSGILLPQEVKNALQSPMIASREAEATVITGTATAQVLKKIMEAGVDPIIYKAAEALMKYSDKPGSQAKTEVPLGGDFLMPLVFFGMLMRDQGLNKDIKNELREMFPSFSAKVGSETMEKKRKEQPDEYTSERIQAILDGLDERLAMGEISESTYNLLKEKWEARKGQV